MEQRACPPASCIAIQRSREVTIASGVPSGRYSGNSLYKGSFAQARSDSSSSVGTLEVVTDSAARKIDLEFLGFHFDIGSGVREGDGTESGSGEPHMSR